LPKKIIVYAPAQQPKQIGEYIKAYENAAVLLKQLKDNGIGPERRSKLLLTDVMEVRQPPKLLTEQEYLIVTSIGSNIGLSDYDSCLILESIIEVMTETLATGRKIRIQRFGTLKTERKARTNKVIFSASAVLLQLINGA